MTVTKLAILQLGSKRIWQRDEQVVGRRTFYPWSADVHCAAKLKPITGIRVQVGNHREELNVERFLYVREQKELSPMTFISRCLPRTNRYVNPWFRFAARADPSHPESR